MTGRERGSFPSEELTLAFFLRRLKTAFSRLPHVDKEGKEIFHEGTLFLRSALDGHQAVELLTEEKKIPMGQKWYEGSKGYKVALTGLEGLGNEGLIEKCQTLEDLKTILERMAGTTERLQAADPGEIGSLNPHDIETVRRFFEMLKPHTQDPHPPAVDEFYIQEDMKRFSNLPEALEYLKR